MVERIPEPTLIKEPATREYNNQLVRVLRNNFAILEQSLSALSGAAADISYDNVTSGATATNVQDALDEIFAASTGISDGDKGDITVSSSGAVWTIDDNVVSNAKLANMAGMTIKGNDTGGTTDPDDLSVAEVKVMLDLAGTNTGDQNVFSTIAISGQSSVVADTSTDTLTLVAGNDIVLTTDAGTDTITIESIRSTLIYLEGGNSASIYGLFQTFEGGDSTTTTYRELDEGDST